MPTLATVTPHEDVTHGHQYRYQFTPKHHGADKEAAQWLPTLSLEEEFQVFNSADEHELADDDGRMYGVERVGPDSLRTLGTRREQVAEFPFAREGETWHGYPLWPLDDGSNRAGEDMRPSKAVFQRMEVVGLITKRGRKRLMQGKHV
jgi:hypothetical protein